MNDLFLNTSHIALNASQATQPAPVAAAFSWQTGEQRYGGLFLATLWFFQELMARLVFGDKYNDHDRARLAPGDVHPHSRARRRLDARFKKQTIPAFRYVGSFNRMLHRSLTRTQWMEKRVRLACDSRISVYGLIYWSHRLIRERIWARFGFQSPYAPVSVAVMGGLSHIQLPPD